MAALFQCNLPWGGCSWWLGHSWSLAVEEQFYLLWPLLFVAIAVQSLSATSIGLLAVTTAGGLFVPQLAPFSPICTGVLLACAPRLQDRLSAFASGSAAAMICLLLTVAPSLSERWPTIKMLLLLAQPVFLTVVFIAAQNRLSLFGRLMQWRMFVAIGTVSYSVYLWQQMFTARQWYFTNLMPFWWVYMLIPVALTSYLLIEKPCTTLGRQLSNKVMRRSSARMGIAAEMAG